MKGQGGSKAGFAEESRGRGVLVLWLGFLWALLLWAQWNRLPHDGPVYDPTARWLERIGQWPVWAGVAIGLGLLSAPLAAWRLGWPVPASPACPWQRAALAYLLMSLGSNLWMFFWSLPAQRFGTPISPLLQQYLYALWLALCLWPQRRWLRMPTLCGWWRWGLCAYGLAMAGAVLYGWLVEPSPSANRAVPLLLQSVGLERSFWLLHLCLVTPLLEESWYRGLLSGPERTRLIAAAVIFAIVHVDPSALPQLFWLGLVFGWARWGGGLAASVLAHALWNVTVTVFLLV